MTGSVEGFFQFCRDREFVRINKESGKPKPWTDDPILRDFYFCNIFREDDKVTRWFRREIREPLRDNHRVAMATVVFRWFNLISTGELIRNLLREDPYDLEHIEAVLRPIQARGDKLYTGAFMINSAPGVDKLTSLLECMKEAKPIASALATDDSWTLQEAHSIFRQIPRLGNFMAYQVVCDLRYTYVLENATDKLTWSSAGPGAARGLVDVYGGPLLGYGSASGQEEMLKQMRGLLDLARDKSKCYWPPTWPAWELSTVQHSLCEYNKYLRGQRGERLKRGYPQ